jgi:hypothetical protein
MEIKKIDKKNPRIALLVDAWFPLYGGGQVHVAEIARQLANMITMLKSLQEKSAGEAVLTNVNSWIILK